MSTAELTMRNLEALSHMPYQAVTRGNTTTLEVAGPCRRNAQEMHELELSKQEEHTVLALLDGGPQDEPVMREARALLGDRGRVILLRVGRPITRSVPRGSLAAPVIEPWEQMAAVEGAAHRDLRELARRFLPGGVPFETQVRFGDTAEEAARAAEAAGATVVVAASRPGGWLPWRNRDRQLARALHVPLVLVHAEDDAPRRGPATQPAHSRA